MFVVMSQHWDFHKMGTDMPSTFVIMQCCKMVSNKLAVVMMTSDLYASSSLGHS